MVFFGITGKGKTHGIADFLDYVRGAQLVNLTLIHDVKESEPQFEGMVIYQADSAFEVETAPTEYPATFVLRRRDLDSVPSMERLARRTLEAGYSDVTTMAVLDEWGRADKDAPSVERLFSEGRGLHASIIAGKQLPMGMPNWARAQADLVIFGLNGAGASFLAEPPIKSYTEATAEIVRQLGERQFIVVPQEGEFDGNVYEVPIPLKVVRCAADCGARHNTAGTDGVAGWLGALFLGLDYLDLTRAGWTYERGNWWCLHCTRRRRLIRLLPSQGDVTSPPPPTEAKK